MVLGVLRGPHIKKTDHSLEVAGVQYLETAQQLGCMRKGLSGQSGLLHDVKLGRGCRHGGSE